MCVVHTVYTVLLTLISYVFLLTSSNQSNPKFKWPSLLTLEAAFYQLLLLTFLLHAQDQSLQSLHAQDQSIVNVDFLILTYSLNLLR